MPYLDYMLDKEMVIYSSKHAVTVGREKLNKKPIEYANNAIDLLNHFSKDDLKKANIKYRIPIMTWERKVINKHHHLDIVQEKVDMLAHQVKVFIEIFDPLFKKGLPFFWKEKGAMLNRDAYYAKLIAHR